ncbi:hypothetical protein PCH70_01860 [Pseudomonas cichorii JBC1]|nr:hypothetical protein PCH70_01860 [Pseudomonas cichorii JBC1]
MRSNPGTGLGHKGSRLNYRVRQLPGRPSSKILIGFEIEPFWTNGLS